MSHRCEVFRWPLLTTLPDWSAPAPGPCAIGLPASAVTSAVQLDFWLHWGSLTAPRALLSGEAGAEVVVGKRKCA